MRWPCWLPPVSPTIRKRPVRFYLVDRILEMKPRQQIRALKRVSAHDLLIEDHPTAGAVLAPALVIESLAQTSAWLILATTGFAQRGVLAGLRHIEVGAPAPLGSRLDLTSTVDSWSDEAVVFNVEAWRSGESVLRIEGALCFLIAADQLEDPKQTEAHYKALCSSEDPTLDRPIRNPVTRPVQMPQWAPYDAVVEVVPGAEATAVKSVVMADPVFATHFPRCAVMPGVLLLQSIVQVARELLGASCDAGTKWRLERIQGARFRKYVRPGDELVLRARVRDLGRDEASLTGSAEVGGVGVVAIRHLVFSREDGPAAG